ncbi:MAG: glycosyltransferase family 39 protein [Myxococcales bacterium]|jgi:hypothetical protein|nr:glycosyltransferase family 39 protein [Myxococcales bacterium]
MIVHKRRLVFNTRLGLALGVAAYLAWLIRSARTLGFCRDESFYFDAAQNHARWIKLLLDSPKRAFERGAVDGAFSYNHEHPSFLKNLFGVSWAYLHEKWHVFDDASTSFRFPGMVMACLAIAVTYSMGSRFYGRVAGLFAAGALALMPRVFYHAHLACFDVGIMAMIAASVWAYERAHATGKPSWIVAFGVVYGMTLDTKHNAWMLPAVFLGHTLVVASTSPKVDVRRAVRLAAPLVSMGTLGPLVCYALWPWLWNDTQPRIREYVSFHMNHEYYNMEFLGRNYFSAPSPPHYAPVMIAATVPTITLVLFAVGAAERLRSFGRLVARRLRTKEAQPELAWTAVQRDALVFAAVAVPLAVFFLPSTPIFGGTKHWFPAYPFMAMLAGRAFSVARARLWPLVRSRIPIRSGMFAAALGLVCLAAPLAATAHSHPFGLSAYVPLAGGTRGGASLGLNRQFWGFTTQSLAPFLEREARPGERIFIHDTTWGAFGRMQQEKRLRSDLSGVGAPTDGDLAIVHHELHMAEADTNIQTAYETTTPVYVLTHDGVPIISVYRRPGTRR